MEVFPGSIHEESALTVRILTLTLWRLHSLASGVNDGSLALIRLYYRTGGQWQGLST